ncbi:NAD(P)-dependent alcohol dehydrogenase [Lederbergia lenta]|uniref:Alcohol dehydrogenase n=1 Tax=Lederbergia lenta TaxID=1467 RepID=A0A2X4YUK1_LEDLE|nr:NAD(P)-dependent alcohol dehydrogenase [Lederbergia lenta]MEC2325413.1 NAD(P)-dependent alcohol dehydrogenase [Lederbergia lenta]SQI55435.1 alcohol dehydrogenase [Lederbergia lenta]
MNTEMKAAILNKPKSIEIKEIPIPEPKNNEALLKVHCIGICGSDVHYYEHGRIGRYVVEKPIILGHEVSGTVVKVGKDVKNLNVGDRVAVEPGIPCGDCDYCRSGRYNLCADVEFMATPPFDGAWSEYVTVKSDFLFKLPDHVSFEEGALIEPLSVGFHAMRRGKVGPGDTLLVTGLGPIGLLTIEAAKMFGISEIYGSDVVAFRRDLALEMGAKGVIDPSKGSVQDQLKEATGDKAIDVLIETSGNAHAVSDTINLVKRGGRVVYVGLPTADSIPIDITSMIDAEIDMLGVFRYVNTYADAIKSLDHPLVDLKKVITDQYPLDDIQKAIEVAMTEKEKSIKVMIYPDSADLQSN